MGRIGEISVWIRYSDCTVATDVNGAITVRRCCKGDIIKTVEFKGGHAQLDGIPPGCYIVEGKLSVGTFPPTLAIVKCDEAVCLNPIVK